MYSSSWNAFSALFVKPPEAPVYTPEPEPEPEPEVAPLLNTSGSPEIVEGRPYADIYTGAGVPASTFPVEKLLAVIEGLANMSPEQIRMVIAAMDAADSSWVIGEAGARGAHPSRHRLEGSRRRMAREQ